MSDETSGAQPPVDAPAADPTDPKPNGANGKHGSKGSTDTAATTTAPVHEAPPRRSRWRGRLLVGLLALSLLTSAVAIGWVAWIVADQPRWLDEITGPQGEQGVTGIQGPQGETGPQGVQGPVGDPGSSADADTLNQLAERLAEVETDLTSNDLGLEAERLATRLEELETQFVDLCDSLRDSFVSVTDACPAGSPAGQDGG